MTTHVENIKELLELREEARENESELFGSLAFRELQGYLSAVKIELERWKNEPWSENVSNNINDCEEAIKLGEKT